MGPRGGFAVRVRASRVLIAFAVAVLAVGAAAPPAQAATWCQCVKYVANYIGRIGIDYAYQAGPNLVNMGHKHYWPTINGPYPKKGDILVMGRWVLGSGKYGHIGFVQGWKVNKKGKLIISMRSANWGNSGLFRDNGCKNVNIVRIPYSGGISWQYSGLNFYRK
jgi:surface antigen